MTKEEQEGMLIGYARVSTVGQPLESQIEQLEAYGCKKIYMEKESGKNRTGRPELQNAMKALRPKDKLVVTKIDRLARSVKDLQNIAEELESEGVGLVFLKEQIDFSTPSGKLMFTMLGAIGEFERDLIVSRTSEGRERAKREGKHLGRKGQDEKEVKKALHLYENRESNGMSVSDISKLTGVPRSTIYAKVKEIKDNG